MASNLNLSTNDKIFPCYYCKEFIDNSSINCRFCGAPIDKAMAQKAAETQDKVNSACSKASYMRITAGALVLSYLLSFILNIGTFAFLFLIFAIPTMYILWMVKYRNLITDDPDFKIAKRRANISLLIWGAMMITWFTVSILLEVIFSRVENA